MPGITSVELMGYNRPSPKRLTFTNRKPDAFSNDRFPGHIKDNWLVIRGTGLTASINKLKVEYNGTEYPTRVIEIAMDDRGHVHVWFAAYKDIALEDASRDEKKPDDEVIGVGAITVTIVTTSGGTSEGEGEINGEGIA